MAGKKNQNFFWHFYGYGKVLKNPRTKNPSPKPEFSPPKVFWAPSFFGLETPVLGKNVGPGKNLRGAPCVPPVDTPPGGFLIFFGVNPIHKTVEETSKKDKNNLMCK